MHNPNVGADRNDTALMATIDLLPGFFQRTIQLDFYARSFSIKCRQLGGGAVPVLFIAYSQQALFGAPNLSAGYHTLFPGEEPLKRQFWRDDEGPPFIWLANGSLGGPIGIPNLRVEFEYFPTRKRDGAQPMPGAGNRDFPSIVESGAIIQPGV